MHERTNALCITQMMDTLIPTRKFGNRVESFFFFPFFCFVLFCFALLCGITVCVTVFPHQGLDAQQQRKVQYAFWPIFSAEGRLFSAFSFNNSGCLAHSISGIIMYTACLEAKEIRMALWGLFQPIGSSSKNWLLVIFGPLTNSQPSVDTGGCNANYTVSVGA